MNRLNKQFVFVFALALLVSLGCSLPGAIGNQVKDLIGEAAPAVEQNPAAPNVIEDLEDTNLPEEQIVEQAQEAASQFITAITGNDTSMLNSYRTTFTLNAEGNNEAGSPVSQHIEMLEEVNRSQDIYHNRITGEGSGENASFGTIEMYVQGENTYLYSPDNPEYPCILIGSSTEVSETEYFRPEDFFGTIETDQLLESGVTANGIKCDHYSVKNSGLDIEETFSANGEVWVAQDGGYVVRFVGQAEGRFDTGEEMGDGTLTWEFNLSDVDAVNVIELPLECQNQLKVVEDVPIPDNATNKEILAGIIIFESPDSPEKVGEFYRTKLPETGWTITEDSSMASLVMMSAEKDGNSLQIMVTTGAPGGASVIITTVQME